MSSKRFAGAAQPQIKGPTVEEQVLKPSTPAISKLTNTTLVAFFLLSAISWSSINLNPLTLFQEFSSIANLFQRMVPPTVESMDRLFSLILETLNMAILGTLIGTLIAIPLAFIGASNSGFGSGVRLVARFIVVAFRSIPELLVAVVAVIALGTGALAGTIALAFTSIGMIGRLLTNALENQDERAALALKSVGAGRVQVLFANQLPTLWPTIVSIVLYRLDINLRASTMLGIVGAGGVGLLLRSSIGTLDYQAALGVILAIALFVFASESISGMIRARILRPPSDRDLAAARKTTVLGPLSQNRLVNWATFYLLLLLTLNAFFQVFEGEAIKSIRWENAVRVVSGLLQPDFITNFQAISTSFLETLAIATLSTLLAGILGIVVGVFSARNITGSLIGYFLARGFLIIKRAFPTIVIGLVFVVALGLGPKAGVLALALGTGGVLAKLIADSLEEIDERPIQALKAIGATRFQQIISGVLPQFLPTLFGHLIYAFDINIRYSAVVGIIGAGGIGYLLLNSIKSFDLGTASALVVLVLISILLLERLSDFLRARIR